MHFLFSFFLFPVGVGVVSGISLSFVLTGHVGDQGEREV